MVPKVQVPMNFGLKYLACPTHCNLMFIDSGGGFYSAANSVIISYNSPVIEDLTTDLAQSEIDVSDFSRDAVQCFVESCYCGNLSSMKKEIFRDASKMAHVFGVDWMKRKCINYFKELLQLVEVDTCFEDQFFLFDEALFVSTYMKSRNLLELVVDKFSAELIKSDHFFVQQFLVNLPLRTNKQLDVIVEITKEKKHILIKAVSDLIKRNAEKFEAKSCYLLEQIGLSSLNSSDSKAYIELLDSFSNLKDPPKEAFRLLILHAKELGSRTQELEQLKAKSIAIPNCNFLNFNSIKDFQDTGSLVTYLSTCSSVVNSYIMYDAMYSWASNNFSSKSVDEKITSFEEFGKILKQRCWKPIVTEYMDKKHDVQRKDLKDVLVPSYKTYHRLVSDQTFTSKELFENNNDIKFYFHHMKRKNCNNEANCGFIVQVNGLFPGGILQCPFSIRVIIDGDSYPDDIKFNGNCIQANNMHLAIKISGNSRDFPITWLGQPVKDKTGKYYVWGEHRFYSKGEGAIPDKNDIYKWFWNWAPDSKITLVAYQLE